MLVSLLLLLALLAVDVAVAFVRIGIDVYAAVRVAFDFVTIDVTVDVTVAAVFSRRAHGTARVGEVVLLQHRLQDRRGGHGV